MEISIKELKQAHDKIMEHFTSLGIDRIDIPFEYYWHIPNEKKYNSYDTPHDFSMGQLSEDIEEIKKIASGKKEPIGYSLAWLASIYSALSEEIP